MAFRYEGEGYRGGEERAIRREEHEIRREEYQIHREERAFYREQREEAFIERRPPFIREPRFLQAGLVVNLNPLTSYVAPPIRQPLQPAAYAQPQPPAAPVQPAPAAVPATPAPADAAPPAPVAVTAPPVPAALNMPAIPPVAGAPIDVAPPAAVPIAAAPAPIEAVRSMQTQLALMGYPEVGKADGLAGPMTNTALQAFSKDHPEVKLAGADAFATQSQVAAQFSQFVARHPEGIRETMEGLKAKIDGQTAAPGDIKQLQNIIVALGGPNELTHAHNDGKWGPESLTAYQSVMRQHGALDIEGSQNKTGADTRVNQWNLLAPPQPGGTSFGSRIGFDDKGVLSQTFASTQAQPTVMGMKPPTLAATSPTQVRQFGPAAQAPN